jgi:hypothetical protein
MPRRKKDSFSVALDAALARHGQATAERDTAVHTVDRLNAEIPRLEATIRVLQQQLGEEVSVGKVEEIRKAVTAIVDGPTNAIPSEIAKLLPRQDLTGIGSIPFDAKAVPVKIASEDDLLPEIEGERLTRE